VHVFEPILRRLPDRWRTPVDWAITIAFAVAIVLVAKAEVANAYRIPSASMEPTLHCAGQAGCLGGVSDRIIANRLAYRYRDPKRGDIVVFHVPRESACGEAGQTFVKRIVGLPGERWSERGGSIYINGRALHESYVNTRQRDFSSYPAHRIPSGQYLMLGDNRANSCDSRVFGTVPRSDLIGPVIAIYWPPSRAGEP
jgi:signal peptidase I